MVASILTIAAIGVTILWWYLQRKTDPANEHKERYEQIDNDIAKQSPQSIVHATDDLDELDRLQRVHDAKSSDSSR